MTYRKWARRQLALVAAAAAAWTALATPAAHAAGQNTLSSGQQLTAGQSITSPAGQYRLTMQSDGNLVEYFEGRPLWASNTAGNADAYVIMQGDGNLVVYDSSGALWASNTGGNPGAYLNLQDDANLVLYSAGNAALWADHAVEDTLTSGQSLNPGQSLESASRAFELLMQGDGNLVLYGPGGATWSTGTSGHPGAFAVLQSDGNLVLYGSAGALWASNTGGESADRTILQDDGNFVVYGASSPLWASSTAAQASLANRIASIAADQAGYSDSPAGTYCNKYSAAMVGLGSPSCGSTGNYAQEWCADFAAWVWRQAGVNFTYGSDLTAAAVSFYTYGLSHGTWHPTSSAYSPQPGDVAVYGLNSAGTYATHAAIVTGGGPDVVNGDWWTGSPSNGGVVEAFGQTTAGGGSLSGYTSP